MLGSFWEGPDSFISHATSTLRSFVVIVGRVSFLHKRRHPPFHPFCQCFDKHSGLLPDVCQRIFDVGRDDRVAFA